MLEFTIDNEGTDVKTDLNSATEFLRNSGVPVANIAQDGMTAYLQMPDGQLQAANVVDLLQEQGLKVTGLMPQNASTEMVNPKYRFLTERLGNDEQKKQLLTMELQQEGIQQPTIVGSGDDWYAFDPKQGRYFALTNKPGLDLTDITSGAGMVAKGIATTLGGVAGAAPGLLATGPGAVVTGAVGAGLAGGLAEEGMQALAAGISPAFREVQTLRGALQEGGKEALFSAPFGALGGVGAWGAKALPKMAEEGLSRTAGYRALSAGTKLNAILGTGVASPALRGAGGFTQAAGNIAGETAGAVARSPLGRSLATSMVPGVGTAQLAGVAMQAPKWLHMAGAKAPGWLARKMNALEEATPDLGALFPSRQVRSGMEDWSKRILTRRPTVGAWNKAEEAMLRGNLRARGFSEEEIARQMMEPRAQDVFGNIVSDVSEKAARSFKPESVENAANIGEKVGSYLGRGMDAASKVGRGIEAGAEEVVGAGLRGIEGVGKAAQYGGRVLKNIGTIAQPYEGRVAGRFGEEEIADWLNRRLNRNQSYKSSIPQDAQGLASYGQ